MMKKKICIIITFLLMLGSLCADTKKSDENKFRGWKTSETEHFNFIYEEGARQTAQAFASIADDAWNKVSKIYGFPQE